MGRKYTKTAFCGECGITEAQLYKLITDGLLIDCDIHTDKLRLSHLGQARVALALTTKAGIKAKIAKQLMATLEGDLFHKIGMDHRGKVALILDGKLLHIVNDTLPVSILHDKLRLHNIVVAVHLATRPSATAMPAEAPQVIPPDRLSTTGIQRQRVGG